MNKVELIERWITALRATEEKQCKVELYKEGAYCAIGIYAKDVRGLNLSELETDNDDALHTYDIVDSLLQDYVGDDGSEYIWKLNDRERFSFSQIADRLESLINEK